MIIAVKFAVSFYYKLIYTEKVSYFSFISPVNLKNLTCIHINFGGFNMWFVFWL